MRKIEIFEPVGACENGACDPMLEMELRRLERMVQDLRERGVSVYRYNVMDDMPAFMDSAAVKKAIAIEGIECLPLTLSDGKIELMGEYPTDLALAKWAGLPWEELQAYADREKRELSSFPNYDGAVCDLDGDNCDGDCKSCT